MKLKSINTKLEYMNSINCLILSVDGVLVLAVSARCITLTISGVGLVVVPVASGIGADLCLFSKLMGEYLKRKEQQNLKKCTLAGTTLQQYSNYIQNV